MIYLRKNSIIDTGNNRVGHPNPHESFCRIQHAHSLMDKMNHSGSLKYLLKLLLLFYSVVLQYCIF